MKYSLLIPALYKLNDIVLDNLRNVAVCFIIALSDETRASDRISIAFAATTVSHRAPSILRHALQTIYGKSIPPPPATGRPDYYALSLPRKSSPSPGRIIPFARIRRRAILLRGHKGVPFYRYENLAKIKNRRLPPSSLPPPPVTSRPPLWRRKRKGLKSIGEYVRERATRGRTREGRSGKVECRIRYEWNALRPHFSEDHLLSRHSPSTPLPIPSLACTLFHRRSSLSPPWYDVFLSLFCSPKFSLHVRSPQCICIPQNRSLDFIGTFRFANWNLKATRVARVCCGLFYTICKSIIFYIRDAPLQFARFLLCFFQNRTWYFFGLFSCVLSLYIIVTFLHLIYASKRATPKTSKLSHFYYSKIIIVSRVQLNKKPDANEAEICNCALEKFIRSHYSQGVSSSLENYCALSCYFPALSRFFHSCFLPIFSRS